ncbi:MAG: GxxExxY protein [Bacteroidota bacterium]
MTDLIYPEKSYKIIGLCMEVHNQLGAGFLEIVYKDALEWEFYRANIPFEREKRYDVYYKGTVLPHHFFADFVVYDSIILEIKGVSGISEAFIAQAMNYLRASGNPLALIVNFGKPSLQTKRIIL